MMIALFAHSSAVAVGSRSRSLAPLQGRHLAPRINQTVAMRTCSVMPAGSRLVSSRLVCCSCAGRRRWLDATRTVVLGLAAEESYEQLAACRPAIRTLARLASHYNITTEWLCGDCGYTVEVVMALMVCDAAVLRFRSPRQRDRSGVWWGPFGNGVLRWLALAGSAVWCEARNRGLAALRG